MILGIYNVDCDDCTAFEPINPTNALGAAVGWFFHRFVDGHRCRIKRVSWREAFNWRT